MDEWLLMNYDSKTSIIRSETLNKKAPFAGTLKLVVTDNAGNKNIYTRKIP